MPRPEPVQFRAGELTLAGTLTLPDTEPPAPRGRYPNVLLLSSYFPRDRDGRLDSSRHPEWFSPPAAVEGHEASRSGPLARFAAALAAHGVASLRYDKRGCGASEGSWAASDWFSIVDDARDALAYLRSRRDADLSRTGILGHGEGAAVALSVAIGDPAIGALTLVAPPARSFRDILRRQVAGRSREPVPAHPFLAAIDRWSEDVIERADRFEDAFELPMPPPAAPVPLNLAGWHQAFQTSGLALGTMLHRSVALVHGDADTFVAPDETRLLQRVLGDAGNDVPVRLLRGAGHELTEVGDEVIDALAAGLAARLLPRQLPPVLVAIEEMG